MEMGGSKGKRKEQVEGGQRGRKEREEAEGGSEGRHREERREGGEARGDGKKGEMKVGREGGTEEGRH